MQGLGLVVVNLVKTGIASKSTANPIDEAASTMLRCLIVLIHAVDFTAYTVNKYCCIASEQGECRLSALHVP